VTFHKLKEEGVRTEMLNMGWRRGVRSDPPKKIVTSSKLGLFLGSKAQEACLLQSVNLTVVQNVLLSFRSIFFNGICPFPFLESSAKLLKYYDNKVMVKKDPKEPKITNDFINQTKTKASLQ
jgi:hypothetical protein